MVTLDMLERVWLSNIDVANSNVKCLQKVFDELSYIYPEEHGKVDLFKTEMKEFFEEYTLADLFNEIIDEEGEYFNCENIHDILFKCVTHETQVLMRQCSDKLSKISVLLTAMQNSYLKRDEEIFNF